jgi:hypothetical protein
MNTAALESHRSGEREPRVRFGVSRPLGKIEPVLRFKMIHAYGKNEPASRLKMSHCHGRESHSERDEYIGAILLPEATKFYTCGRRI